MGVFQRQRPVRYEPLEKGWITTSLCGESRNGCPHNGVDFGFPETSCAGGDVVYPSAGKPVYAIQSGTVIHAGSATGYGGDASGLAGWLVIDSTVEEGGGCLEYGHICRLPDIDVGSHVEAGQQIAIINPDPNTNGGFPPHLHVSDWRTAYGQGTKGDPLPRLKGAFESPNTQDRERDRKEEGKTVMENAVGWTGDPTWLEDVLREALGDRLVVLEGWQNRGTGCGECGSHEMGPIWGVLIHHTGNAKEKPETIRDGCWQPDGFLCGPLSHGLITPDGKFYLVAIGPCNSAGPGIYPGVGEGKQGNTRLIGIECAWPTIRPDKTYDEHEPWPDPQIWTMRDATAAILAKLGYDSSHVIGHKEWAGEENPLHLNSQGKWDPGNMSMDWFRGEVAKAMRGDFKVAEHMNEPAPSAPAAPSERELMEQIWSEVRRSAGTNREASAPTDNRALLEAILSSLRTSTVGSTTGS